MVRPVRRTAVEGVSRVRGKHNSVAEVRADPRGGFAAVVGGDACDDEIVQLPVAQAPVEVSLTMEAGVDVLGDQ